MSLPFIAFYMGDYQRDTLQLPLEGHGAYFLLLQYCWTNGRIPPEDAARAAICKVPVSRWRKQLAPLVAGYFDENGENKRANTEIAKAEKLRIRQAMAGHHGGLESARRKAEKKENIQATAKPRLSHGQPVVNPRYSHGEAIKKEEDITTTFSEAAREVPPVENPENPQKPPPEPVETPAGSPAKGRNLAASPELLATLARKYR
jgi:uncharacterized protein YdaU (DUF1376 family)